MEVCLISVLFVCSGNICRSPLAQGIFEEMVRREGLEGEILADSAGTHAFYHEGEPPDMRAQRAASARGLDISSQRARIFTPGDCNRFDYVLTMDETNYRLVSEMCGDSQAEVQPFLDYAPDVPASEIPDPYYGGASGFERAIDLSEAASRGLLQNIRERHLPRRV